MKSNTLKILFLAGFLFACLLASAQDKKISQLTALPSMTGAEYVPCAISGSNYYLTPNQIKTWLNIPATLYFNSPLSVSSNTVSLGTVPITKGGTGQVSYTNGDMLYYGGYTNMSILNIGSSGKVLTSNGSVPTWSTITSGTTYTNTSPITITSGTVIGISQSNTSTSGYLSSTDWNTFNGKATLPSNSAGALVNNGSGSLSWLGYGSANTNSYLVQRDASGNASFNNVVEASTTVVSATQTVVMTYGSSNTQKITGTSPVTFNLPDATYLTLNENYYFNNNSTGSVNIRLNDGSTLLVNALAGSYIEVICTDNTTTNGTWDYHSYLPSNATAGTVGITAASFITSGGTSSQFVKGDGSLDGTNYQKSIGSYSITSTASPTITVVTGQDLQVTIAPTLTVNTTFKMAGTPSDGQKLTLILADNSSSHTLTFTTGSGQFVFGAAIPAPSATNGTGTDLFLGFIYTVYGANAGKWNCVASNQF